MTRLNGLKEISLDGYPLTKVAVHKNPYLKNQDKTIATAQYVTETLADFKGVGFGYNAELIMKTDTLIVDDTGHDIVFGLYAIIENDDKFYYSPDTLDNTKQIEIHDDFVGVYMPYYARFPDNKVRKFDETYLTSGYNFTWKPEEIPNLSLSPKMTNVKINIPAATAGNEDTYAYLRYPSAKFLSGDSITSSSNYTNLIVEVNNTYLDLPSTKSSSIIPFTNILIMNYSYFCDLIDFTEPLEATTIRCKTDLSVLTNLKTIYIFNFVTTSMNTSVITENLKKIFNLTSKTVSIDYNLDLVTIDIS